MLTKNTTLSAFLTIVFIFSAESRAGNIELDTEYTPQSFFKAIQRSGLYYHNKIAVLRQLERFALEED
ncbi:MAG TPA: hypothetical protein DD412_03855 [Holosporales bacterium]|nr:hypothetical protein [Holosporales bacterium]